MGNEEQIYNPVAGINRMLSDIKDAVNPILFKMHPTMRILSDINLYIVLFVFLGLIVYLMAVRKHRLLDKLKKQKTYITVGILLCVYAVFGIRPLYIGPSFSINFNIVAAPIAAKLLGPIVGGIFGILQYLTSFLMHHGERFSSSNMIIAGIGGIIYALFIYDKRTKYLRCLWAKLTVNIVCNIILVPLVTTDTMTTELADFITARILSNIFLAPFQTYLIWLALIAVRKLRHWLE